MKCSLLVLSCYLDNELEPARRGELEAHLVGCPRCRSGLSHLREEVERVGALAQVHVPDHSVHALFEQIGLIGPDDPLPPRASSGFEPVVVDAPPWLATGPASALPWTPPPKYHPGHYERPVAGGDDAGLAADALDVELHGTAQHSVSAAPSPPGAPDLDAAPDPEADAHADADADEESGVPSLPLPPPPGASAAPPDVAPAETATPWSPRAALVGPPSPPPPPAPPTVEVAGIADVPGVEADPAPAEPDLEAPSVIPEPGIAASTPPVFPAPPPPPVVSEDSLRRDRLMLGFPAEVTPSPPPSPAPAAPAAASEREAKASSAPGDAPVAASEERAPVAASPPTDPTDITSAGPDTGEQPGPPASDGGDPAVALRTPETPLYPMTDDDVLDDDGFAGDPYAGGPIPAPRMGLLERLRERFALHRAITRPPGHDLEDGVEIVSGAGAPIRGPHRSRAELARRRSEALRPSALPGDQPEAPAVPETARPLLERLAERSASAPPPITAAPLPTGRPGPDPRSFPSVDVPAPAPEAREEPFGIAQRGLFDPFNPDSDIDGIPGRLAPAPYEPPPPAHSESPDRGERPAWRPRSDVEVAGQVGGTVVTRPKVPATAASPSEARESRRLLVIFGAAVLVMFAVGLASARSSSPLPVAGPTATTPPQATAKAAPSAAPSARASVAPSAPAATQGAATALQLTGITTLGDGGTGWQVQGIRYGTHPGYLRIVLDFGPAAGSASGTPKTTIGFEDPTTLDIIIDGVVPAGGTGSLPNTATVTSVTLVTPSPKPGSVVYRLKLAHAVSPNAEFATSPLRLILDLHS